MLEQFNEYNDKFLARIETYERKCIRAFESKKKKREEFKKAINEIESSFSTFTLTLNEVFMNSKLLISLR